jgi:hypothetical protein
VPTIRDGRSDGFHGATARVAIILTGIVTGLLLRFIQIAANL